MHIQDGKTLFIPFKGDRDYVSGSDIVERLIELAGANGKVSVQMHKMASHGITASWVSNAQLMTLRKSGDLCGFMAYTNKGSDERIIAVVEDKTRPVESSVPFDEASVIEGHSISGKTISQPTPSTGTFLERIVALNKRLLIDTAGKAKWIFCGLDVCHIPGDANALSIEHTETIKNSMFQSALTADSEALGTIQFVRQE